MEPFVTIGMKLCLSPLSLLAFSIPSSSGQKAIQPSYLEEKAIKIWIYHSFFIFLHCDKDKKENINFADSFWNCRHIQIAYLYK